jgi:hypothetical protein
MDISVYLKRTYAIPHGGIVSENCYRPAREGLFKSTGENLTVVNELRQRAVDAPLTKFCSIILTRKRS